MGSKKKTKTPRSPRRQGAIIVLLDPEERAQVDEAAKEMGLGAGPFLRTVGLERARAAQRKRAVA